MNEEKKPLEDIVKNIISGMGGRTRLGEEEILKAWKEAAGVRASRHSRPKSFKGAILIVNVDSSGWLYELTVGKKEILKRLGERLKGKAIKDIRFRIGETK